jgi:hypothetical protein
MTGIGSSKVHTGAPAGGGAGGGEKLCHVIPNEMSVEMVAGIEGIVSPRTANADRALLLHCGVKLERVAIDDVES